MGTTEEKNTGEVSEVGRQPLTPEERQLLTKYLVSRYAGEKNGGDYYAVPIAALLIVLLLYRGALGLSLIPFVVGAVITFVNGNIGAGVAIGGAFSLIRFRSAQGTADEIAAILIAMGAGIAYGMGYLAYGIIILVVLALLYFLLASLHLFDSKPLREERLLKVTVPESLEYTELFDEPFARYLNSVERLGVKTTGMGSMFRLSFLVRMKDPKEEKAFIDELRTRNGNLEIALLPYSEQQAQL